MYTEIQRCSAIDYFDEFAVKIPTEPEKPLKEMNSEEYQNYKLVSFARSSDELQQYRFDLLLLSLFFGVNVFRGINRSTLSHITGKLPLKMPMQEKLK